jgi:hypothetical protein
VTIKRLFLLVPLALLSCQRPIKEPQEAAEDPSELRRITVAAAESAEVVLVYGGELRGYLKPCGSTVHMLGGLGRRATFVEKLRQRTSAPLLLVDFGNLVEDTGLQSRLKLGTVLAAYAAMGYDALSLGAQDLALGTPFLVQELKPFPDLPLLSANMTIEGLEDRLRPFRRIKRGGFSVFVTAVIDPDLAGPTPGVTIADPAETIRRLAGEARAADLRILLAHATVETCRAWAKELPFFDVVVGGIDQTLPPDPETIGTATCVGAEMRGNYGLALSLQRPARGAWIAERIKEPLREELGEDPAFEELYKQYQKKLAANETLLLPESRPHPNGRYVGSAACGDCHEKALSIWKGTKHSHALETIKPLGSEVDPECLICHSTGYRYDSGFLTVQKTPNLGGVGCESCHGPGERHADDGEASSIDLAGETTCSGCHTKIQSPYFSYKAYFPQIAHKED